MLNLPKNCQVFHLFHSHSKPVIILWIFIGTLKEKPRIANSAYFNGENLLKCKQISAKMKRAHIVAHICMIPWGYYTSSLHSLKPPTYGSCSSKLGE